MPAEVDFWTRYSSLCLKAKACPLQSVFKRLKGTEFCCAVDVVRQENWPFLLAALKDDECLTSVQIGSNLYSAENQREIKTERKRKSGLQFPVPYGCSDRNVTDICECVAHLLSNSKALMILKLENLCLKEEDALVLEKGLKDSQIEQFSLAGCRFQGNAFEIICRGLQLSNVQWLDVTSGDLDSSGVSYICKIIKAHNHRRSNEMFQHTLRYQLPVFDEMKGLNRITLNNNSIRDAGVEMLADCFSEDFWVKALDLQKCGIGNDGAKAILNVAKRNAGLYLIDLRLNNMDESIVDRIVLQLALNNMGKVVKYNLGSLWKPRKTIKFASRKVFLKTKVSKHSPPKGKLLLKKELKSVPKNTKLNKLPTEDATSQTTIDYERELRKAKSIISKYNIIKHQLNKYKRENHQLHKQIENFSVEDNYVLIDHETFREVKTTFEKFKTFLDIMKKNGLWDCIAILEANESAHNILKPLISEAITKYLKTLKNDSYSEQPTQSDSNASLNDLMKHTIHMQKISDLTNYQKIKLQSKVSCENTNEQKLFYSRVLPEMNHVKKPVPSDKALAQKVFKEVMENYTNSSKSSEPAESMKPLEIRVHNKKNLSPTKTLKESLLESTNKMAQMKTLFRQRSDISNEHVSNDRQTQKPSTSKHFQNDPNNSVNKEKATDNTVPKTLFSTSASLSDSASTIRKSSDIESEQSSTYKTLPNFSNKDNALSKKNPVIPEKNSRKESIIYSSESITKSSLSTDKYTSPEESENSISTKSSKRSHKSQSSSESSSSKHSTLVSKTKIPKNKTVEKPISSASSVSSYSSKNSHKVKESSQHSEDNGSEKSYLESVSEASTDKDVKSLSEEVISSDGSKKDSKISQKLNVILTEQTSKESTSLAAENKAVVPTAEMESAGKSAEMHSELVRKAVGGFGAESSETKMTLKEGVTQIPSKKPEKDDKSESSVPSLSDITTVSSQSLNTDSVMGQLSD